MKSIVDITINAPRAKLVELFANPENIPKWMDDTKYEPISGTPGQPGSKYRMISTTGQMDFVATVVASDPNQTRLDLDSPMVAVAITDTFIELGPQQTRLISEEEFRFKGLLNRVKGLFAGGAIKKAHRRHMEAFKRFGEGASVS